MNSKEPAKPSRLRRSVFKGTSLVLSLLVCFAVGEGFVRWNFLSVNPKHFFEPGIFRREDDRLWGLRPNYRGHFKDYLDAKATGVNGLGYRGPEETPARLRSELRVICLGDSVGFGRGVADGESYPARLESALRKQGVDGAVFNLCVPGYDTIQERITLEQNVERIDPHVVVLGWYRNDATSNAPGPRGLALIDGYLIANEEAYRAFRRRVDRSTWRRSALLRYISVKVKMAKKNRKLATRMGYSLEPDPEELAPSLLELNRIQEICLARGARFILVIHPNREETLKQRPDRETAKILTRGVETGRFQESTTVLPLLEQWEGSGGLELYLPGDRCHLSARGHIDVAERLAQMILSTGTH